MSEFNIEVASGSAVLLPTGGKYCDRDIIVTTAGTPSKSLIERTITEITDNTVETIGRQSFSYCQSLTRVNFPSVKSIMAGGFQGCSALVEADFGAVETINGLAFGTCTKLTTLIIRTDTVCTLAATSAFSGSPFASTGTGGTVYVPSALIEEYANATNWSTLRVAFVALEGSEYE